MQPLQCTAYMVVELQLASNRCVIHPRERSLQQGFVHKVDQRTISSPPRRTQRAESVLRRRERIPVAALSVTSERPTVPQQQAAPPPATASAYRSRASGARADSTAPFRSTIWCAAFAPASAGPHSRQRTSSARAPCRKRPSPRGPEPTKPLPTNFSRTTPSRRASRPPHRAYNISFK